MNHQTVYGVEIIQVPRLIEGDGMYAFRPDRRFKWLQNLCFYVLDLLGARRPISVFEPKFVRIDTGKFMTAILEQRAQVMTTMGEMPVKMYIGAGDFAGLVGEDDILQNPVRFRTAFKFGQDGGVKIVDMDVTVVPWMEGILTLPLGY